MDRFILAAVSTLTLSLAATGMASAADLPMKAPAAAVPMYSWTGFYVGFNAGYNWGRGDVDTVAGPGPFAPTFGPESIVAAALASTSIDPGQRGFIGGAQIGYNWQFASRWLAGFEADIQGLSNGQSASLTTGSGVPGFPTEAFISTTTVAKKVDWLGTLRARLGILVTPSLLAYGTGGLAYGGVKASTTIAQSDTGILPGPVTATATTTGSYSETRVGWALGGGMEWMFAPHWSLKGEYLHYDLGKASWTSPNLVANTVFGSPTFSAIGIQSTTRFSGDIARAGINYIF
jgi:outer membrane immunogenic protein